MISTRTRAALLLGGACFAGYALTAAPGVTWEHNGEDGPEFAAVGLVFGIPHPTGYPLFTLLLRLAVRLGQLGGLEPARSATLLTAFCGATAVTLLAWLFMTWLERAGAAPGVAWCGLVGAALFAVSPNFWGQANIIEVYPLHLAFVALLFGLATTWRGSPARLALLGYVAGLGLAHHLTTALLAPSLSWLAARHGRLTPRALGLAALALLAGVTLYAVLLLRSRLDPPLDWGNPESLRQLAWHVTGRQYQNRLFQADVPRVLGRLGGIMGTHLPAQFGWVAWPLGALGAVAFARRAGAVIGALLTLFVVQLVFVANYSIPDPEAFYLPAMLAWAGLCAFGLATLVERLRGDGGGARGRLAAWAPALLLAWPVLMAAVTAPRVDLHRDSEARRYSREALAALPPDALVLTEGDGRSFALWYEQAVLHRFDAAIVYRALLEWPWYLDDLRRRHPGLAVPSATLAVEQRPLELLRQAVGRRPVFTTFSNRWLARTFVHHPVGDLFALDGFREPSVSPAGPAFSSQPLALADYFNSACRLDAAATGFPGGEITWGTVRFQVASVPGEPGTLAGLGVDAARPAPAVRVPLRPEPTRALCLLVSGQNLRHRAAPLARVRVLAGADTLGTVSLVPFLNLWDAPTVAAGLQIPDDLEVLAGSSLSVVIVPFDQPSVPDALELAGLPGDAGADRTPGAAGTAGAPGVAVVAITQVLWR